MTQAKAARKQMAAEDFRAIDHTTVFWLGNGGAMINSRGTIILIDPLLKGFDMPIYTEAPVLPEEIPHADAVLITHCDNDHFSRDTLLELKDKTGSFHAPHYVASLFEELGIDAEGHDIYDTFQIADCTITLTPADHAWQNESPKHAAVRHYAMEDYCGFRIETPDGLVWMPGDSRLMEEQLTYEHPDLILMDISDGSWHIGLDGVKKLTDVYDDSVLIPIHWGCVRSDWKEFNGNPAVVRDMICHPERFKEVACGEAVRLERL